MGQAQRSLNQTEQKSHNEATQFVAEHGVEGISDFYRKKVSELKDVQLHFLVTGETGAGKSSFINAIRG
jgi:predicted GTPase